MLLLPPLKELVQDDQVGSVAVLMLCHSVQVLGVHVAEQTREGAVQSKVHEFALRMRLHDGVLFDLYTKEEYCGRCVQDCQISYLQPDVTNEPVGPNDHQGHSNLPEQFGQGAQSLLRQSSVGDHQSEGPAEQAHIRTSVPGSFPSDKESLRDGLEELRSVGQQVLGAVLHEVAADLVVHLEEEASRDGASLLTQRI